ncbi:MAG TPA: BrxA/BrxB family bacilliredoxin [Gemmatimonadales bacterium]|nr:BrxA/BrxB family bacilliredoxin [Gemmatimonadales bacterium]
MNPLNIVRQPAAASQAQTMYDERFVAPMREELVRIGFQELRTPEEVDAELQHQQGTTLVVVNSICGCAAGRARPGVALAVRHEPRPQRLTTVFAGQDRPATDRARSYFEGQPPSSPQIALFKDGRMVFMMQRREIEGRDAPEIAEQLIEAFDEYCG